MSVTFTVIHHTNESSSITYDLITSFLNKNKSPIIDANVRHSNTTSDEEAHHQHMHIQIYVLDRGI